MELKGKLVAKLPVTTYGKEGKKKGGLVIEYGDKYPKKAAFTVFEPLGVSAAKLIKKLKFSESKFLCLMNSSTFSLRKKLKLIIL